MLPLITPLEPTDYSRVLELNETNSRATSPLDANGLAALIAQSAYARGISKPCQAFLVAMDENATYDSVNYRWFRRRHAHFIYIDRIVVDEAARGNGLGRALYTDLIAFAQDGGYERIGCEVNLDPPNPASDAFHEALGFEEAGRSTIHDGLKTVRYLEKTL